MNRDIIRSIFVWVGIIFILALIILCFSNDIWSTAVKSGIEWILAIAGLIEISIIVTKLIKKLRGE